MEKKIAIIAGCTALFLALSIVTKGKIIILLVIGAVAYFAYKNN